MRSPTPPVRARLRLRVALGAVVVMVFNAPLAADAQGRVKGVRQGAQAGNKAAGPVGGVLGGAIGGVVGVFTGVLGVGNSGQAPASGTNDAKQPGSAKTAKGAKGGKGTNQAVLTQPGAPQLTAEQIVASSDANIDRIKAELKLTPEQEKHWTDFNSAMHYLGHNGADRLNLRTAGACARRRRRSRQKQCGRVGRCRRIFSRCHVPRCPRAACACPSGARWRRRRNRASSPGSRAAGGRRSLIQARRNRSSWCAPSRRVRWDYSGRGPADWGCA